MRNVLVTAGTHTINVGGTTEGILMGMRFDNGDDGGGGGMPEDVNGDCTVDVSDLLANHFCVGKYLPLIQFELP